MSNYLQPDGSVPVSPGGGSAPIQTNPTAANQVLKFRLVSGVLKGIWENQTTIPGTVYPTGDYTVKVTDQFVYATTGAARAITLPTAPPEGWTVQIKDVTGTASSNNITVSGAVNINGSSTFVMATNYQVQRFIYSATNSLWYTA